MAVSINQYALTDLEAVRAYLGFADAETTWDELLKRCINSASSIIEKYCDRKFKPRWYLNDPNSLEADGNETDLIILKHFPVDEESLTVYIGEPNNWSELAETEYAVYEDSGQIRVKSVQLYYTNRQEAVIPSGIQNVRVDYVGGYDPLPEDLAWCAMEQTVLLFKQTPAAITGLGRVGLDTRSTGDVAESFIDSPILPDYIKKVLDGYKRNDFIGLMPGVAGSI